MKPISCYCTQSTHGVATQCLFGIRGKAVGWLARKIPS